MRVNLLHKYIWLFCIQTHISNTLVVIKSLSYTIIHIYTNTYSLHIHFNNLDLCPQGINYNLNSAGHSKLVRNVLYNYYYYFKILKVEQIELSFVRYLNDCAKDKITDGQVVRN